MNRRRLLTAALLLPLVAATPVAAQEGSATRDGMRLTVSKVSGLAADGEKVRVRGSGYDRSKGIYVAFCVDNGPGRQPTPCGGGADTEGRSGNSVWISDLPPAYGTGLARPYGEGGTFDVEITVRARLNEDVDCRRTRCAVVTRADHTRSEDRSLDVAVPISFARPTTATTAPAPAPQRSGATAAAQPRPAAGATAVGARAVGARADGATAGPSAPAPATSPEPSPTSAPPTDRTTTAGVGTAPTAAQPAGSPAGDGALAATVPAAGSGRGWSLLAAALLVMAGLGIGARRALLARLPRGRR
ncbi:MAG TPA: hypothetical protein VNU26_12065 [Mycobacteriales bacterium]|nr:hypothetical protein [Mycobacteriales bacterium]